MADATADASASRAAPQTPPPSSPKPPLNTPSVNKGPPLTGQRASAKYDEASSMLVHEMAEYIAHAKTIAARVRTNLWTEIESFSDAMHPEVNVKDAIAGMPSSPIKPESSLYIPVSRLLNTISLAYYLTCSASPGIKPIVFHSNPDQKTLGDFLGVQTKPDSASGVGDLPLLYMAARLFLENKALSRRDFPCSANTSVGEDKLDLDVAMGQFKVYMRNHKCYRPDMATVHGFRLAKAPQTKDACGHAYDVVLASMNAGGLTCSPPVDVTSIDPWIAHVVMVYDSYVTRNASFSLAQDSFVRWDVELEDGRVLALAPFYVTPPPGRVTFATFEVPSSVPAASLLETEFRNSDTLGFVKFSWQDEAREWKERDLLERVHKGGWLPGVVRPYPSQLKSSSPPIRQLGLDEGMSRAFEMLHLGSIGEPLSQCETPKEMLMVIYDVLETSLNMIELDVIHRDLSWFNVFCKPKHDANICPGKVTLKQRCIASILGEGHEPCALIADLDHSAVLSELLAREGPARTEKTGTPMFKALELTCPSELSQSSGGYNDLFVSFDPLVDAFERIEEEKYRATLLEAFPDDDLTFAATFSAIVADEKARRKAVDRGQRPKYVVPDLPHAPRHDAESVYWVLVWALGRARPKDAPDPRTGVFDSFCSSMLKEGSAVTPGARLCYLTSAAFRNLLHPGLESFAQLLQFMAVYFTIPWDLYRERVSRDHAHTALRRLLLLEFLRGNEKALAVLLDTAQPRRTMAFARETSKKSVSTVVLAKTGDASSGMTPEQPQDTAPPTAAGAKRPLENDDDADDADADADAEGAGGSASVFPRPPKPAKRLNTGNGNVGAGSGSRSQSAETAKATWHDRYTEKEHLDKRSAGSLRLKFWKDRLLWFGNGF